MNGADLDNLPSFLAGHAAGELIFWPAELEMMDIFKLDCTAADALIMQHGYLPARYQRNRSMLSISHQHRLLDAQVAVIGCGGLGGYVIEELARLGVGRMRVIDPDVFEEHNLNRQLLATIDNLGSSKVAAAVQRVQEINPATRVEPRQVAVELSNGQEVLAGVDLVVDAIDNISGRLELAEICNRLGVPLVHGAIAGWFGQVASVDPGRDTLQKLYANWTAGKGIESGMGNPSFTPAVAASLQVAETCKLLLGLGHPLQDRVLSIDLLQMQFDEIPV